MGHSSNNTTVSTNHISQSFGCSNCGKFIYDATPNKLKLLRKLHLKVCTKQLGDFGIDYFSKIDSKNDTQKLNKQTKLFCNDIQFVENTNKITQ
jgi:ribosomal protein L33